MACRPESRTTRTMNPRRSGRGHFIAVATTLLLAAGCATVRTHVAVPPTLTTLAELPGLPGVRYAAVEDETRLEAAVAAAIQAAPAGQREVALLTVSGGGSRGGFGAGVLCGWSERGDRPEFQVVCGVSSGALIAPFAFLGPGFDQRLRAAFTGLSNHDIYRVRNPLAALDNDSLVSTEPLARTLAGLIDQEALQRIAEQHRRGRRLFVLSTDLDAQRAVVWDLGAIAASGRPDAGELFHRVMLASSAMPVAFPPQYFPVVAGGRAFDEMHVDGGLMVQAFLPLPSREAVGAGRRLQAYAILNGKLGGDWMSVSPRVVAIATRTFHTIARTQSLINLREIAHRAKEVDAEFRCARIPANFLLQSHTGFNQAYMQALYELGRTTMRDGAGFSDSLPGLAPDR